MSHHEGGDKHQQSHNIGSALFEQDISHNSAGGQLKSLAAVLDHHEHDCDDSQHFSLHLCDLNIIYSNISSAHFKWQFIVFFQKMKKT